MTLRAAVPMAPGGAEDPPAEIVLESFHLTEAERRPLLVCSSILMRAFAKNPAPALRYRAQADRFLRIGVEREAEAVKRAGRDPSMLDMADRLIKYKYVVKQVARQHGATATFMPKPIFEDNGSGMHCHQSLFGKNGENAFFQEGAEYDGVSEIMRWYIGGLLEHARGLVAVTNPLVNSYKRLVPGYEAPTVLAWSMRNRSPLIPRARAPRHRHALRGAHARPVLQPVPGLRCHAGRRPRRYRQQARSG